MSKKNITILVAIIFFVAAIIVARFLTAEDRWICVDNQWITHGQPAGEPPTEGCGEPGQNIPPENTPDENTTPLPENPDLFVSPKGATIKLDNFSSGTLIVNPLVITGEARGTWYFEASFPARLLNADGETLATGMAQANADWMTEDFVPFTLNLTFTVPSTKTGFLILQKDNPSGLAENADEISIPITFAGQETQTVKLYYYNATLDKDADGNIQCSRQGLAPVDRQIPLTLTPIQDSIKLLLQGELTDAERTQGIGTEYPLSGLALKGALLREGNLTLEFNDPENKTSGGACRAGILWAQIEATAKQFPGVETVKFIPEDIFQP